MLTGLRSPGIGRIPHLGGQVTWVCPDAAGFDWGEVPSPAGIAGHVSDLGLVVAGDIVYNGVHPYLAGGEKARPLAERRNHWIAVIDKIAAVDRASSSRGTRPHLFPGTTVNDRARRVVASDLRKRSAVRYGRRGRGGDGRRR
jgi:hypothetical protein